MNIENFIDNLTEIFEDANPETINPEAKFRGIEGYSSLAAFLIIGMINDEYNIEFTADDLRKSETIADIFSRIKSKWKCRVNIIILTQDKNTGKALRTLKPAKPVDF